MGEAYTPGLQISEATIVNKTRRLPIPGEILIKQGETVTPETIIAQCLMPGPIEITNVADILHIDPAQLKGHLIKKVGDNIQKGEIVAQKKGFLGLFKRECKCSIHGTVEYISYVTGQVHFRAPSVPVNVKAYIPGKVVQVLPKEGAIIECQACYIQGIFGVGGEIHGEVVMAAKSPDETLTEEEILPEYAGKIIVGGANITEKAIQKAYKIGVKGIITGGIDDRDLIKFLGYDIGVAITGEEDLNASIIVTEGFGRMSMSERTFNLLKRSEGKEASINGATQIRAGVIRPEIIIPLEAKNIAGLQKFEDTSSRLEVGTNVRIIRGAYFGFLGRVTNLSTEPQIIDSESKVVIIKVRLEDGKEIALPRANVEIMQMK